MLQRPFLRAGFASKAKQAFSVTSPFKLHRLEEGPETTVTATKEELLSYFKLMYTMRRMEIQCDTEYKARAIRGFCHLYDGQEAVATGIEAGLDRQDAWITSYRCHCAMLARGGSVSGILGELFGTASGSMGGKGGSMHFYNKETNFYGGQGIVGAQVPVGTGLAFAAKYNHDEKKNKEMPCAITMYGDGAANQGQIWEAANMASLWSLPMIFCIENNHYGMGTSTERSSSNDEYYTMGNQIPGIWCDGMDVLAVKSCMAFAKAYTGAGKGPLFVEMSTYRYHGHSMSDPGITYRNRDEIASVRAARDPLDSLKKRLVEEAQMVTSDELKAIEKDIRSQVTAATKEAKASGIPDNMTAFEDIYKVDDQGQMAFPPYIRTVEDTHSLLHGSPKV